MELPQFILLFGDNVRTRIIHQLILNDQLQISQFKINNSDNSERKWETLRKNAKATIRRHLIDLESNGFVHQIKKKGIRGRYWKLDFSNPLLQQLKEKSSRTSSEDWNELIHEFLSVNELDEFTFSQIYKFVNEDKEMILSKPIEDRNVALEKLLPYQRMYSSKQKRFSISNKSIISR